MIDASDRAERIAAADAQIQAFADNREYYVLPNVYNWMHPLLTAFGDDPHGWLDLVRDIVDSLPKRSDERIELKRVHRRIESRVDQQIRRRRIRSALDAYKRTHGEFPDRAAEAQYAKDIFGLWKAQRQNMLCKLTLSYSGKAPAEERQISCVEFWEDLDSQIASGLVPSIDDLKQRRKQAQYIYELFYAPNRKST